MSISSAKSDSNNSNAAAANNPLINDITRCIMTASELQASGVYILNGDGLIAVATPDPSAEDAEYLDEMPLAPGVVYALIPLKHDPATLPAGITMPTKTKLIGGHTGVTPMIIRWLTTRLKGVPIMNANDYDLSPIKKTRNCGGDFIIQRGSPCGGYRNPHNGGRYHACTNKHCTHFNKRYARLAPCTGTIKHTIRRKCSRLVFGDGDAACPSPNCSNH